MTRENRIFIEKPKETMTYKEHTRKEIENSRKALEPVIAKGEIMFAELFKKETSWGVNPSIVDKVNPLREKNSIMSNNPNQTYSFEVKLDNGLRFVVPGVTLLNVAPDCKITATTLPSTERFIVCLLENGKLAPSDSPKQHKTRESAEKEAERLCRLYHQEFVVLQVVSAVKPQEPKKEVFA